MSLTELAAEPVVPDNYQVCAELLDSGALLSAEAIPGPVGWLFNYLQSYDEASANRRQVLRRGGFNPVFQPLVGAIDAAALELQIDGELAPDDLVAVCERLDGAYLLAQRLASYWQEDLGVMAPPLWHNPAVAMQLYLRTGRSQLEQITS